MSKNELIEKTLKSLQQLPEHELHEIHDFVEFLLSRIDKKILSEQVSHINISSKSYNFLKEEADLYTVNDLKVKYGDEER